MSIILSTLLQGLQYSLLTGDLKGRITSVEYDSRKITEGSHLKYEMMTYSMDRGLEHGT